MALNLSDGQLTTSSATLVTLDNASHYIVAKFLNNSQTTDVDVYLTLTRTASGTARTIARATLEPYEAMYISGLALDQADTLAGYATLGSAIDYLISRDDRDEANFTIFCRTADGAPKTSTTLSVEIPEKTGPDAGEQEIIDLLRELRDAAFRIA